jgi:hypothetical protein
MSVQVETIGYRFKVSKGSSVFDVISTTDIGITKSNEIIRAFFDNFKILRTDRILKQEGAIINECNTDISGAGGEGGAGNEISKVEAEKIAMPARKKREAMKNIWGHLRELLNDEFTAVDYTKALRDAGYEYTKGSWGTVPGVQLKKIVKMGKIEKVEGTNPVQYRKIKVPHSFRSDHEAEKTLKSLRAGEKALLGSIR